VKLNDFLCTGVSCHDDPQRRSYFSSLNILCIITNTIHRTYCARS